MDIIEGGIVKNNNTGLINCDCDYNYDFGFTCRYDISSGWHTIGVNHKTFLWVENVLSKANEYVINCSNIQKE